MLSHFHIRDAVWEKDEAALRLVRRRVFIEEQGVPADLEWDGMDPVSNHVLALNGAGSPVGVGRLLPDGKIGRMAVLPEFRERGVGRGLLQEILRLAREAGHQEVYLHAQETAVPFYERAGFVKVGEPFAEAGIPHREMRLRLARKNQNETQES